MSKSKKKKRRKKKGDLGIYPVSNLRYRLLPDGCDCPVGDEHFQPLFLPGSLLISNPSHTTPSLSQKNIN
jgi:hypothetical protein